MYWLVPSPRDFEIEDVVPLIAARHVVQLLEVLETTRSAPKRRHKRDKKTNRALAQLKRRIRNPLLHL